MSLDVHLGIDMETDIGSFTDQYRGVLEGTPRLLEILHRHDVKGTFFWTGHAAQHHPAVVAAVCNAGHEIGCHGLFHETLGDPLFALPNNWPVLPEEVHGRIERATRIIEHIAGQRPVSFRCPRLWGSTHVVRVLDALGYRADATLPMRFFPDRLTPYHPSRDDWSKPGDLPLVEIPNFCDPCWSDDVPDQRDLDPWPRFRTESAEALLRCVDRFIDHVRNRGLPAVVSLYLHPWEFCDMPQGPIDYGEATVTPRSFITDRCGEHACAQLDQVLQGLADRGSHFRAARQIAAQWS